MGSLSDRRDTLGCGLFGHWGLNVDGVGVESALDMTPFQGNGVVDAATLTHWNDRV